MTERRPRAVFLDRDGVVNRAVIRNGKPYPPASAGELEIPPDAASSLAGLKDMGLLLLIVTNQPDVARGRQSRSEVEAIHNALRAHLPLDDFFVCYHDDGDNCDCRKPKPGLLLQARNRYRVELENSFLIGDRWRDIDAGSSAGCATVLIDYGYKERGPSSAPSAVVKSLADAARWIGTHMTKEELQR